MKYILRIIAASYMIIAPGLFIAEWWIQKDYFRTIVWLIVFIANIFVVYETINFSNKRFEKENK